MWKIKTPTQSLSVKIRHKVLYIPHFTNLPLTTEYFTRLLRILIKFRHLFPHLLLLLRRCHCHICTTIVFRHHKSHSLTWHSRVSLKIIFNRFQLIFFHEMPTLPPPPPPSSQLFCNIPFSPLLIELQWAFK